jgi:hypothetical protein
MSRPGAPCRHILEASQTSGGTPPRRPAQTTHVKWVLNTKGLTTHLHPLLGLAHRLQVPSHRRRVDKIIC